MLNKKRTAGWARLRLLLALPLTGSMLCMSTMAFTKDYGYVDLLPEKSEFTTPIQDNPKVENIKKNDTLRLKKAKKTDQIKFPPPIVRPDKPLKIKKTPPPPVEPPPPHKTDQIKFPPPIVKPDKPSKGVKTPPPPVEPPPPHKKDQIKFPPPVVKPDKPSKGSEIPPPPVEPPPPHKKDVVRFPPPIVKPDKPIKGVKTPPPPVEPPKTASIKWKKGTPPAPVEPTKTLNIKLNEATPPPPVDPATKPINIKLKEGNPTSLKLNEQRKVVEGNLKKLTLAQMNTNEKIKGEIKKQISLEREKLLEQQLNEVGNKGKN